MIKIPKSCLPQNFPQLLYITTVTDTCKFYYVVREITNRILVEIPNRAEFFSNFLSNIYQELSHPDFLSAMACIILKYKFNNVSYILHTPYKIQLILQELSHVITV